MLKLRVKTLLVQASLEHFQIICGFENSWEFPFCAKYYDRDCSWVIYTAHAKVFYSPIETSYSFRQTSILLIHVLLFSETFHIRWQTVCSQWNKFDQIMNHERKITIDPIHHLVMASLIGKSMLVSLLSKELFIKAQC